MTSGKGTILYGTIFHIRDYKFFNIEDIFYFKGNDLSYYNQNKKLNVLYIFMNNYIDQHFYTKSSVIFGLPIISKNYESIKKQVNNLPYQIYAIQNRNPDKKNIFYNEVIQQSNLVNNLTFLVKPTIYTDIYELYYYNKNRLEKLDVISYT